jgi:hypothetical protein
MPYASVRELRTFNSWHPFEATEKLAKIGSKTYRASKKPLVDYDYDGQIVDDVIIQEGYTIESIDENRGIIMLASEPSGDVTATYYWHPIGDSEIDLAIGSASVEIEALTGTKYIPHTVTEYHKLYFGEYLYLSEPVVSIESITDESSGKTLSSDEYEVIDAKNGVVRLKNIFAGQIVPPWFLPTTYSFKVVYQAGYEEIPAIVKHAVILIASYNILFRIARQITFSEDYTRIAIGFKTPEELDARIKLLADEIERIKTHLPRRVAKT